MVVNDEIQEIMGEILSDRAVPRNIRAKVEEATGKVRQNNAT